jgi:hypothetical protein
MRVGRKPYNLAVNEIIRWLRAAAFKQRTAQLLSGMQESGKKMFSFNRVDHVSLTMLDLEAAIDFYTRVFWAELAYRMGPFEAAQIPRMGDGRDWIEARINVPGARL